MYIKKLFVQRKKNISRPKVLDKLNSTKRCFLDRKERPNYSSYKIFEKRRRRRRKTETTVRSGRYIKKNCS